MRLVVSFTHLFYIFDWMVLNWIERCRRQFVKWKRSKKEVFCLVLTFNECIWTVPWVIRLKCVCVCKWIEIKFKLIKNEQFLLFFFFCDRDNYDDVDEYGGGELGWVLILKSELPPKTRREDLNHSIQTCHLFPVGWYNFIWNCDCPKFAITRYLSIQTVSINQTINKSKVHETHILAGYF